VLKAPRAADLAVAAIAIALIAAGAIGVFVVEDGTGVAALVAAGTVLLAIVALGERIESLRWGEVELKLRRQADVAAEAGDQNLERELRTAADALAARAAPVATSYEAVRAAMKPGPQRTAAMEAEIGRAREDAASSEFSREDLARLFRTGGDGERVYALGVMQERPELAVSDLVLEAVRSPKTPFEHFHALVLADILEPDLTPAQRQALAAALRHLLESRAVRRDSDRAAVAARLLQRLDGRSGT
jgi:hypothetical protein